MQLVEGRKCDKRGRGSRSDGDRGEGGPERGLGGHPVYHPCPCLTLLALPRRYLPSILQGLGSAKRYAADPHALHNPEEPAPASFLPPARPCAHRSSIASSLLRPDSVPQCFNSVDFKISSSRSPSYRPPASPGTLEGCFQRRFYT